MEKTDVLKGLTKEQERAVTYKEGPLLIVAGAGTGKTTVITRRIAYLIGKKFAKPSEILALTFTEKAAAEMEERVDVLVPYGYIDTWISTFHAFGDRIISEHTFDLGLPTNYKVLSRAEQIIFFREHLFDFDLDLLRPLGNPTSHIEAILKLFSRIADENISSQEFLRFTQKKYRNAQNEEEKKQAQINLEIAQAYQKYQDLKLQEGLIDFSDQIVLVLKLFKEHPQVLKKYQEQFKYVLVDEFQDTNFAQNQLVEVLARPPHNITVVGDDDQSIYRFRGAAISNILDFKKKFPKAQEIILKDNFRSGQAILDSAYQLIRYNDPDRLEVLNHIEKKLVSHKTSQKPEHLAFGTASEAAIAVAKRIQALSKKIAYKDIAILIRANSSAPNYLEALKTLGIPAIFSGVSGLFSQPEIMMLINIAKSIYPHANPLCFYHFLTNEITGFSTSEIMPILAEASSKHRKLEEFLRKDLDSLSAPEALKTRLRDILVDLDNFRTESLKLSAGQLLYDYLLKKNYFKKLTRNPSTENEIKINNIAQFFDRIHQFEQAANDKSLPSFVKYLDSMLEVGEDPALVQINTDINAVNVMTVHAAKGLEFEVVFMADLVADKFPSRKRTDSLELPSEMIKERLPEGDWHIQEERRLFYVAMTRAKDRLYLVSAKDYGGVRARKLSPFVLEALGSYANVEKTTVLNAQEKIKRFANREPIRVPLKFFEEGKLVLSFMHIDDYLTCPLKFKFVHIVKIPVLKHHPLVYGTAIHAAIEHYFRHKINSEKVTVDDLIRVFEDTWDSTGFVSREHEDERIATGKKTLKKFFITMEESRDYPAQVEEPFKVSVKLDGKTIKLKGRLDAIYDRNGEIEVRDFKTSDVKDQESADRRGRESLQLVLYAMSYQEKTGTVPKTSLYFVESGLIGYGKTDEKAFEKLKNKVLQAVEGIEKEDFSATPGPIVCDQCPYSDICPKAYKG